MNVLCPECQTSVPIAAQDPWLRCPSCGLQADLSRLETAPGVGGTLVEDLTGTRLGGYRLERLIGVGGMGVVYRALDADGETPVAVKVLHGEMTLRRDAFVERFRREAKALSRLEHPGIVRLRDSGEDQGRHYLVMEHVDGENLGQLLADGPLELGRAVDVVVQVCEALAYAHAQGIVHRDIKPANILVKGDEVKVVDFGLAQITGWESTLSTLTRTNLAMGTFNYLSPEQRRSAKQVDGRADLFSLGVVLYEALTGDLPLGAFAPPSRKVPALPRRLDGIVRRVLAVEPEERYPDAEALAAALRPLARPARLPRATAAAIGVALLVGVAGGGLWWLWPQGPGAKRGEALAQQLGAPAAATDAGPLLDDQKSQLFSPNKGSKAQKKAQEKKQKIRPNQPAQADAPNSNAPGGLSKPPPNRAAPVKVKRVRRPNPWRRFKRPEAFFASIGKGGVKPGPPPKWVYGADDPGLLSAWRHYWSVYRRQRRANRKVTVKGAPNSSRVKRAGSPSPRPVAAPPRRRAPPLIRKKSK